MSPDVAELIAQAAERPMTEAEARSQAISFAYGNCAIDNPAVTREVVEREAAKLPLDRILAGIHADAADKPAEFLDRTQVPDGGE